MRHPRLSLAAAAVTALLIVGCGDSTGPDAEPPENESLPTVVTADIANIGLHSAVSGGEVTGDGGQEVLARGVVWSVSPNPTIADNRTVDGRGIGPFTSDLTGLTSGAAYYVRAYATSHAGTSYGGQRLFRTRQGTVADIDGNVYEIVRIDGLWWMAENLKVTRYRNGDPIPTSLDDHAWEHTLVGAYAIYPHALTGDLTSDAEVARLYGLIYNWFVTADPRGVCPEGWRVPNNDDWQYLESFLGGLNVAGGRLKSTRTDPMPHPRWRSPNQATDDFGFAALPSGRRLYNGGHSGWGTHANYLSASDRDTLHSWSRFFYHESSQTHVNYSFKQNGNSLRCVKDVESGGERAG
jgi:uncharacterized protein (TIGR02145 family)